MKWVVNFFDPVSPKSHFVTCDSIEAAVADCRSKFPAAIIIGVKLYL